MVARKVVCIFAFALSTCNSSQAQDNRTQYPAFLTKAYFSANVGYIDYPFSNSHLEDGYRSTSVKVPHLAVKLILLGYRINETFSTQITYMRHLIFCFCP